MKPETRHHHFTRHRHRPPHPHTLHARRHSWPPFKLSFPSLPSSPKTTQPPSPSPSPSSPITDDDDPFPHFLSPQASPDPEAYIFDYMTASIDPAPVRRSRARSASPPRTAPSPPYYALPPRAGPTTQAIAKLRAWMERMEARYRYRWPRDGGAPAPDRKRKAASPPPDDVEMADGSSGDEGPVSPARGRKTLRRSRGSVGAGARGHSGRPRVWRSPPSDMWTVLEDEGEDETMGLGIAV